MCVVSVVLTRVDVCGVAVTSSETEGEGPGVDGAGETQELLSSQTSAEAERSRCKGEHDKWPSADLKC